jgi:hypothetical protein
MATMGGLATVLACSPGTMTDSYPQAVSDIWRHSRVENDNMQAILHELVRYATLAPSSHNTQCWKFHIEDHAISVLPDLSRRCPVVDPDDHHLFLSIGCATENLIQAASANGLHGDAVFDSTSGGILRVSLEPGKAVKTSLFNAIPERQSTRAEYDGKPISTNELAMLEKAGSGKGVRIILINERAAMEKVLDYVVQGNTVQMNDSAFVEELKAWIRFSEIDAVRTGDGLYSAASGNPSVPSWLGSLLFGLFFTPKNENDKYTRQVRSSAGIAVFVSDTESPAQWIDVGRCYERFALQCTALGIRTAMLNQPVEVAAMRPQFGSFLGIGECRPDLVVRFGRGPKLPQSLRRPVEKVLA